MAENARNIGQRLRQGPLSVLPGGDGGVEILCGDLHDISLPTLLQLVQLEAISGWMAIDRHARIDIAKGHLVRAEIAGLRGVEALREILFREGGVFRVFRGEPVVAETIECVPFAVMDACRLRDEWERIADSTLAFVGGQRWKDTGAAVDQVMAVIDGQRTLRQICADQDAPITLIVDGILDAMAMGLFEFRGGGSVASTGLSLDDAFDLLESGEEFGEAGGDVFGEAGRGESDAIPEEMVQVPAAPVASAASAASTASAGGLQTPPRDFFALLDEARAHLRRGDLDGAEALVRAALDQRPSDRLALQNLRAIETKRARYGA